MFEQRLEQLKADMNQFSHWEDRYKWIIDQGKKLSAIPENLQIEANLVRGCQSRVWLWVTLTEEKKMHIQADSDAMIVKGLVALMLRLFDGLTPQEVLNANPEFISELGLAQHLSQSRANGLVAMIKQIKNFALVYSHVP